MDNKLLVEKPKLSFIDRIKKRILLLFMDVSRFNLAKSVIRNDPEVIDELFKRFPDQVVKNNYISTALKEDAILRNQELIEQLQGFSREKFIIKNIDRLDDQTRILENLDSMVQYRILSERPDIIIRMSETISHIQRLPKCIKYLPKEQQNRILREIISYNGGKSKPNSYSLEYFSEDVVEKFVIEEILKEQKRPKKNSRYVPYEMIDIYKCDFSKCSQELQLKLALADNQLLDKMSPEVIEKFANGNLLVISMILPEDAKSIFEKNNPQYEELLVNENKILFRMIHDNETNQIYTIEEVKKIIFACGLAYYEEANLYGSLSKKLAKLMYMSLVKYVQIYMH